MAYIRSASNTDITTGTSVDLAVSPKNLVDNVWFLDGSTLTGIKNFGTVSNHEIPFIQNNTERMRLTATGLGIGTTSPNVKLEIDNVTANTSGLRFTQLTSASPTTAGQAIGVDASGNVVRISVAVEALQALNLAGSSGTPQILGNNDTITIAAGTGITTTAGATDTVTVALNATLDNLTDVVITSAANKEYLKFNGTNWVDSLILIDDLSDVDTTSSAPTNGQVLQWNGTNWVPGTVSAGGSDFTLAATSGTPQIISSNDTMTIAAGTGISTTAGATDTVTIALNATLDNLSDVTITTPSANQVVQYNGSAWVNSAIAIDELSDVDTTTAAPSSGDSLTWNTTNWVPTSVIRNFVLAGTSGTPQTITDGNTLTIAAGTGITTTAGSTDTVTVALNATLDNLSDVTITTPSSTQILQYNGSAWVNATMGVTSVGVTDTAEIDMSISNPTTTPTISAVLLTTTVTNGSYGSASAVGTFTVDTKGRLTAAATTSIAIAASQTTSGTFVDARIAQSNVTQHQAALTILESQITDGAILARVGGNETISGTWSFNNNISIPLTPTQSTHAASKGYVDGLITGLDWKNSVRVASTATVTVTYNATAGASARGQITAAPNTLDGVTLAANDRILLKDQSTGAQNGIWVVTTLGTGSDGVWDRATDFDSDAEVTAGAAVFVTEGTANADTGWTLTTNDAIVIGGGSGTALTFAQFSGAGQITAGAGLTKTGNTIDVATASASRIVVNADNIDLATTAVSAASYGSATAVGTFTVDAYGRLTAASNTNIAIPINSLTDVDTVTDTPNTGEVLSWNGTNWVPVPLAVNGATNGLQVISDDIGLGGTLTQNSTITQSTYNLIFNQDSTGKIGIDEGTPLSGIDINTSVSCGAIRTVTVDATLNDTDYMVLVNNSSTATITLPAAASVARREYVIKKISTGGATVVIDPNSTELIDGASTYTISSSYVSVKIKSNGTSWFIF